MIPEEMILFSVKLIQTWCDPGDVFQLLMDPTWVHPWRAVGSRRDSPKICWKRNFSKIPDVAEWAEPLPSLHKSLHLIPDPFTFP